MLTVILVRRDFIGREVYNNEKRAAARRRKARIRKYYRGPYTRLLEWIPQTDDNQINRIIQAVIHRYDLMYPDQELSFLSLPRKDGLERERALNSILSLLEEVRRR